MKVYEDESRKNVLGTTVTDPYGDRKHYLAPMFYAPTGYSKRSVIQTKGCWYERILKS